MIYIKYSLLIIISFVLVFLDVSFFSFLDIYGATLLTSFIFLIIFTIMDKSKKDYILISLANVFFYSIFSSLPVLTILFGFFIVPMTIAFLRERHLPEPTSMVSIVYFILSTLLFEGVLLIYLKAWNAEGLLTLAWFVFINTFLGFAAYATYLRVRMNFSAPEIKL